MIKSAQASAGTHTREKNKMPRFFYWSGRTRSFARFRVHQCTIDTRSTTLKWCTAECVCTCAGKHMPRNRVYIITILPGFFLYYQSLNLLTGWLAGWLAWLVVSPFACVNQFKSVILFCAIDLCIFDSYLSIFLCRRVFCQFFFEISLHSFCLSFYLLMCVFVTKLMLSLPLRWFKIVFCILYFVCIFHSYTQLNKPWLKWSRETRR